MPNGERDQVEVSDLARSKYACGIGDLRVEQADVVGPELMERARTGLGKALHDRPHG